MKLVKPISVLATALLVASIANAAPKGKSIPFVDSGPFQHVDGSGPHRDSMNILAQARAAHISANANVPESRDVGDVAVIVDDGTLIIPPRPPKLYDIPTGTILTFTPGADEFTVSSAGGGVVAPGGAVPFPLTDDDSQPLPLAPFSFPFLGTDYGGAANPPIFMGSDGHITFGAGDGSSDPRDAARHIGGPPRVSVLLVDLNPDIFTGGGGFVGHEITATTITFSWIGVPQFGELDSNSFQAILHDDGRIDLVYGAVSASVGVVGVAEGNDEPPFNEVDMTMDLPGTFGAGAIFEEFIPGNVLPQMNTLGVAQKFLESHPDEFDFIVVFTDFIVDIGGGAFAFHAGVQNQTLGLGIFRDVFDDTALLENAATGPIDELESVLNMNRIGLYWPDTRKMVNPPIKKFRFAGAASTNGPPGPAQITTRARRMGTLNGDFGFHGSYTLGLNSAMSIMGQEAGHRWLAFPIFLPPSFDFFDIFDLLGRDDAHWSFFHNVRVPDSQFGGVPRASSAEGNAILDLGPGASAGLPMPCTGPGESTFLTERNELIDGFTELDQYFMGLRTAGEVPPFWYVDDPRSAFSGNSLEFAKSFDAQDDVVFCGKRVDLNVSDITIIDTLLGGLVPENGPRIPAIGDEVDDCGVDIKTMAFVVLVPGNPSQHKSGIKQVDTFRATWQAYANGPATGARGRFDTSLNPACH